MDDKSLRLDIVDELDFEPSIDAADIGVAVSNGIVTLTGHVNTYSEKLKVEEVVWHVRGVEGIAQQIEVRAAGRRRAADDEIAQRAINQLKWNTTIPDEQLHVKVQNGWITLQGKVEWQYQKSAAYEAVCHLEGVRGVSNMIEIQPKASSGDIKKRIEEALKRNAEVEAAGIRVNVAGGKVTLEGKIKAWPERQIVERAAWAAPGVQDVEDRLTL